MKISNITIIFIILSLFISSCSSSNEENKKTIQPHTIEIAFASWPGFDIIYYAQIKNLFAKYNLNIKLTKYSDQEAATKALQNLKVDAAMTSIFDALQLQSSNKFNIILSTNVSAGADGLVAQKNIKSFKELKGKTVSAQKGTVNELILFEALELNKMTFSDVKILDITNEDALPKLFHKNLDAAIIWEPLLSKTKNKIDGNVLFTTKELDSSVIDVLIVGDSSFNEHKKEWKKFLYVWFDLMKELRNNKTKVMKVIEKKTINPNFARDYSGLKAGTIELNKDIFFNERLENAINKINSFTKVENQASLILKKEFLKNSILDWNQLQSKD